MKRAFVLACLLAGAFSTEAAAEVVFLGTIVFTKAENCEFSSAGQVQKSVFHPNQPASNQDFSGLTTVNDFGARAYHVDGSFTEDFKKADAVGVGWSGFSWKGSEVRITRMKPGTIKQSTRSVTLKGQIKKHSDDPNGAECIVTFEASYSRDPND